MREYACLIASRNQALPTACGTCKEGARHTPQAEAMQYVKSWIVGLGTDTAPWTPDQAERMYESELCICYIPKCYVPCLPGMLMVSARPPHHSTFRGCFGATSHPA